MTDSDLYSKFKPLNSVNELFDLTDRVAIISGGAGKMGQQFAKTLSLAGCKVAIVDLNKDYVEKVAADLSTTVDKTVVGLMGDFAKEEQVSDVFSSVRRQLGPVDVFIHNVMPKPDGYYKAFENYTVETWNTVMEGALTGGFLACREASKDMLKSERGSIVLTSSTYGVSGPDQRIYEACDPNGNIYGGGDPLTQPACYSTYKGGIISMTRHLAAFWGKQNIRVNCLTPGGVYDGQEEGFHKAYTDRTPMGRMATWTDYNGAILFLSSDASRYMTGANLIVDGGWTCW